MIATHRDLFITGLTPEFHERTCGYWYLVRERCTPHTAFATRAGLVRWLVERGLHVAEPINEPGTWSHHDIAGSYRTESHYSPDEVEAWCAIVPVTVTRALSNGDWVEAKITLDHDGIRTVHTLNPNVRNRWVFNHADSLRLMDGAA